MRRLWLVGCVLSLTFGLVACDGERDPDPDPDSGTPTETDAGGGETRGVVMAVDGDELVAADLSCLGTRTAPTAGAEMEFPIRTVSRGVSDGPAADTSVQIWTTNLVPTATDCGTGCTAVTTDGAGMATVTLPADGWFAYRVIGDEVAGSATTVQHNFPTDLTSFDAEPTPSPAIELSVIGQSLFQTAIGTGFVTVQEGTMLFTGTATDCMGRPLHGVSLRVFGASGEVQGGTMTMRTGPRLIYWPDDSPFPASSREFTSLQGRYAGANIPADDTIRVEIWGILEEGGELSMIGCEAIPGSPDVVNLLNIGPARSDGPADCSGS